MNEKNQTLSEMTTEQRLVAITGMSGEERLTALMKALGKRIHSGRPIKNAEDTDIPGTRRLVRSVGGVKYTYVKTEKAGGGMFADKAKAMTCSVEVFEAFWAELELEDGVDEATRQAVIAALKQIPAETWNGIEYVTLWPNKLDVTRINKLKPGDEAVAKEPHEQGTDAKP